MQNNTPSPVSRDKVAEAVEAAARAMCDRVNGAGDYDENIKLRRPGWLKQAQAGIDAYLLALAQPAAGVGDQA